MKSSLFLFSALTVALLMPLVSIQAAIIKVPGDHQTIQAGINAASSGDTVLVSDGQYQETKQCIRQIDLKCRHEGAGHDQDGCNPTPTRDPTRHNFRFVEDGVENQRADREHEDIKGPTPHIPGFNEAAHIFEKGRVSSTS